VSDSVTSGNKWIVGECEVVFNTTAADVIWDSSTGLVIGVPDGETDRKILNYTGKSYGTIPVGGTTIELPPNAILEYKYWYY
jgi:hypothetical protein